MTTDKQIEALLPCPFCGDTLPFVERADYSSAYVMCNGCGAKGATKCQEDDDEETPGESAAIKAWNARTEATHEQYKPLVEALERIQKAQGSGSADARFLASIAAEALAAWQKVRG